MSGLSYLEVVAEFRSGILKEKKALRFCCEGVSMNPVLKNGDEIQVTRVPLSDLHFGDIVTHEIDGSFITHRFFYIKQKDGLNFLTIKADNSFKFDQSVSSSSFVGKVAQIFYSDGTINILASGWQSMSRLIAALSFIEGVFFGLLHATKRSVFRTIPVNNRLKQRTKNFLRKPKQWLLRFLLFFFHRHI